MSHENWNDDNDFLSGALHGAADEMPGGEVDDLHISFGVIRDRVRRRRAAKIGSLAGGSLVVAGVLAFGVVQTPLWDSTDPVVPGVQSPDAYASPDGDAPTQGPEPTAEPSTAPAASVIQDDYQPSWLEWSDLTCGMPVDDLRSTASGWSVAATGDIYARTSDQGGGTPSTSWGMSATVQEGDAGTLDVPPVLVWSQDGVVVDLGANVFGAPIQGAPLLGAVDGAVEAQGNGLTTCAPTESEAVDYFETPLPEGDYEVRVVGFPEVASGQWATAVSAPVSVRIDADGAHSPTGTRGGDATIEPPGRADGEQSRFVLDRTTDWVTASMTYRNYASADPVSVTAQCESSNPADSVSFEVVRQSNQQVLGSGEIACHGAQSVTPFGVVDGAEESLDIRLGSVPDGVARLWASLAPTPADDGEDTASDCSASGLDLAYDPANSPSEGAGATAQAIVEAASGCDADGLIGLATEHGTELMFGNETPEQTFGLPETEALPYETLVRLLAGTNGVVNGGDAGNETITWPRVSTDEFRDSDEAWAEAVESGLLTQAEADAQRADETFGYTGMVIGIAEDGTWRYYSPTD